MPADYFIDSNVFVYDMLGTDPAKQEIASDLIARAHRMRDGGISFQVITECLNVALRLSTTNVSIDTAQFYLNDVLVPILQPIPPEPMYRRALQVKSRYGFHFYDSLIIAAALTDGCTTLYTEDMQHGQRIQDLTIINPFR